MIAKRGKANALLGSIIAAMSLSPLSCSVIHERDTDSIRVDIVEDRVFYRDGDTLLLNLKLTNSGRYDVVISDHGKSFRLNAPPSGQYPGWTGEWFTGIDNRACSDGCLFTLQAGASRAVTTQFVPLHSTAGYPELDLVAFYRVTVKLDGVETAYTARSNDTVKVTAEGEQK